VDEAEGVTWRQSEGARLGLGAFGAEWRRADAPGQVHASQKGDSGVIAAGVVGDVTSADFEIEGERAWVASRFGAVACIRSSMRRGGRDRWRRAPMAWDSLPSGASALLLAKAEGREDGNDR
jgi:hypothetical protein